VITGTGGGQSGAEGEWDTAMFETVNNGQIRLRLGMQREAKKEGKEIEKSYGEAIKQRTGRYLDPKKVFKAIDPTPPKALDKMFKQFTISRTEKRLLVQYRPG